MTAKKMTIENIFETVRAEIQKSVRKAFNVEFENFDLDFPPDIRLGDFAVNFFPLTKELKKSPTEIAKKVASKISTENIIESAKAEGPYLNLKLKNQVLFESVYFDISREGENFGKSQIGKGGKVMVEYLSPNTNKPLHLGHLRNGSLGTALANILKNCGFETIKTILINDRGVHICKSMLAWQRWGNEETPESTGIKGDHFVGKWYVRYAIESEKDPRLKEEVQRMLQKWEAGERETLELWKRMNQWVYDGFSKTYDKFGLNFDVSLYESDTYKLGKNIIEKGLKKGVFKKDEQGGIVFELSEKKFGLDKNEQSKKVTVLRPDGTSVYMTQDIGTTVFKAEKYGLDRSIFVVGSEQIHHFQCLFEILRALEYPWADGLFHLSYGMVYLPDGKMKSREGKVVDADNLIEEVQDLAISEIRKRGDSSSEKEIKERAKKVALGAIKFYLMRVKPSQDIHFDPKESLSFEGFTGPYCQYAYARISGIIRKAKEEERMFPQADFALLGNEEELLLIQKLMHFPKEVEKAAKEYNPLKVLSATYETAKAFNQFYNAHPVIQAKDKKLVAARLKLIEATAVVIKKGLELLGIEVMERM